MIIQLAGGLSCMQLIKFEPVSQHQFCNLQFTEKKVPNGKTSEWFFSPFSIFPSSTMVPTQVRWGMEEEVGQGEVEKGFPNTGAKPTLMDSSTQEAAHGAWQALPPSYKWRRSMWNSRSYPSRGWPAGIGGPHRPNGCLGEASADRNCSVMSLRALSKPYNNSSLDRHTQNTQTSGTWALVP